MAEPYRILARFLPQAWIRDYATEVDPEGEVSWDCTAYILAYYKTWYSRLQRLSQAEAVEHNERAEWQGLNNDPAAPEWVREWGGPFEIEVRLELSGKTETAPLTEVKHDYSFHVYLTAVVVVSAVSEEAARSHLPVRPLSVTPAAFGPYGRPDSESSVVKDLTFVSDVDASLLFEVDGVNVEQKGD